MNEETALAILTARRLLGESGGLYNCGVYLSWNPGDEGATLDGEFDADDLEAIAWWMRNKGEQ
jgi:hypothetical protein